MPCMTKRVFSRITYIRDFEVSREYQPGTLPQNRHQPIECGVDRPGRAGEAQAHEPLAAGPERGARRQPDPGLVDQSPGQDLGVRLAVDREEAVEAGARPGDAHPLELR